ncbi:hypothetical protein [Lentilactobacillus senioris]|uniref:hypothetical protein n=1 Tax=Lentilactobacillus senioris TaxID=931534 RepID=UPI000B129076
MPPHQLVQAFKSTLAEAANADLLVQVVDYSDPDYQLMMETTAKTLAEIGIENRPMIVALNKADRIEGPYPTREGNDLIMAATDETSLQELTSMIVELAFDDYETKTLLIPFNRGGDVISYLNDNANVLSTEYLAEGTQVTVELGGADLNRFDDFLITN